MPGGNVSFERKVLPLDCNASSISYPKANSWSTSVVSLCPFEVYSSGLIEDQPSEALEVDFANKYLGGGALSRGCVQEEIRFMINPELIVGMLFLPSMSDNEAIEIVGAERFSNYSGYASSFQYGGDHVDKKDIDFMKRRKTRIIAIDALVCPERKQYGLECLLRETNKAFCGFYDQCKYDHCKMLFSKEGYPTNQSDQDAEGPRNMPLNKSMADNASTSCQTNEHLAERFTGNFKEKNCHKDEIGIVTGNWGCGAFGGDPELKAIIQWLAASQALRPFIAYCTVDLEELLRLDQVTKWITSHGWNVGDLWNMLVEYSSKRLRGETKVGFLEWLVPLN